MSVDEIRAIIDDLLDEDAERRFASLQDAVKGVRNEFRADETGAATAFARAPMSEPVSFEESTMMQNLGEEVLVDRYLRFAEQGDIVAVAGLIAGGMPVSVQHYRTGETALHVAAACNARHMVCFLTSLSDCDFLKRDNRQNLPSDSAYLYGQNPAIARYLSIKERKRAKEQGVNLTRRP